MCVCPVFAGSIVRRSPICICVYVCVSVSMDLFLGCWRGYVYVRMLYLLDTDFFSLFRARSAAYSSNYASNTVHELCVCVVLVLILM